MDGEGVGVGELELESGFSTFSFAAETLTCVGATGGFLNIVVV